MSSQVMWQTHAHWDSQKAPSLSTVTSSSASQDRTCIEIPLYTAMETESGNRETAGRVVVEKEVVKEALTELLGEIPAFRALVSGESSRPARQLADRSSSADEGTSREADDRDEASKCRGSQTLSGGSNQSDAG